MDSVRGLHFISSMNSLVSASEDCTLKVWDATKFGTMKDIEGVINFEPFLTLRGHLEPILALAGRTAPNCFNDNVVLSGS